MLWPTTSTIILRGGNSNVQEQSGMTILDTDVCEPLSENKSVNRKNINNILTETSFQQSIMFLEQHLNRQNGLGAHILPSAQNVRMCAPHKSVYALSANIKWNLYIQGKYTVNTVLIHLLQFLWSSLILLIISSSEFQHKIIRWLLQ